MKKLIKFLREFFPRSKVFLTEVRGEWKKVTKPARREVIQTTIVVVVTSVVFAIYLWLSDSAILWIYEKTFDLLGLSRSGG